MDPPERERLWCGDNYSVNTMTPNSLLHDILGALLIAALILITSFYC